MEKGRVGRKGAVWEVEKDSIAREDTRNPTLP